MKKFIAILLTVSMIMAFALTASAAETTLPDSDGTGWWVGHTEGVEVTEEGVTITFTNTTYAAAPDVDANGNPCNWFGPLYVLYAGDEAKVNGAGYVEYWVQRGDNYGWGNAAYYGVTGDLNTNVADNMTAAAITYSSTGIDGWVGWENFLSSLKAGANGSVTAKLVDGKAEIVFVINGLQSTLVAPVDTTKPVYISLFAEQATLTNIKVVTPDPEPEIPVEPAAGYTAELNVNWDSNPRSNVVIDGPGEYSMNVDMTYWGEGSVGFANVIIPDAYEALKGYTANLKITLGDTVVYDSAITPNPQYVDDGTGNYVASNNYYIELFASWNETNLVESIPYGSNMVVTLTLTDPNAVTPDPENPKDGDSISVFVALMAISAVGAAVVLKKKSF